MDKTERTNAVLTMNSSFVTNKAAADLLARTYQTESTVQERITEVRSQSRSIFTNTNSRTIAKCMLTEFT